MEGVQRRIFVRFDEKMWKWQTLKTNENLRNIRPRVKAIHRSVIIHPYTDKAYIEGVQRRVLDQIDEKLSKIQTFENS